MLSEGEKQLRGEFSGRFLKQENLEWKKKRAEEGRKRKNGGGLQETSLWREKRRGGNEGWVYVTGDRMRQLLNGWLTDEEHDRLIRLGGGGENSFQVFSP